MLTEGGGQHKKLTNWAYALAFLIVGFGLTNLVRFIPQSGTPLGSLEWETAAVVSADGSQRALDSAAALPPLEEGESYQFSLTLPENRTRETRLMFDAGGLEAAVYLDGQQVWYSVALASTEDSELGPVQLTLPVGGGETLTMVLRPASPSSSISQPPVLRFPDVSGYGLPAEMSTRMLILFWGLFLMNAARGTPNWQLLLPMLTAALRTVQHLAVRYQGNALPQAVLSALSGPWLIVLAALVMAVYLALQRRRGFWKAFGILTAVSVGGMLALSAFSAVRNHTWGDTFAGTAARLLRSGDVVRILYWVTLWAIMICALLAAWELARSILRTQRESQALALRNQLIMDNYRALEQKMRESAALRHEFKHRLLAIDSMLQARDLEGLERCVDDWKEESAASSPLLYSSNLVVNAILQDAAGRARAAGVSFRVTALVPEELPFPDEDLCALLMNLLDNALEGAARTPEGQERSILFRARIFKGFLVLRCENTFDGYVKTDGQGRLLTIKDEPSSHGFGMAQMRSVAHKYHARLDVDYNGQRFTVQTALQLPDAA